ncbi:hypothetical protein ACFX13_009657 [Malus domestica]
MLKLVALSFFCKSNSLGNLGTSCSRQVLGERNILYAHKSDALFILLVEKNAAFIRFSEDRFYNRFPCIILTAEGQQDVATRLFLWQLKLELKLTGAGSGGQGSAQAGNFISLRLWLKNMSYDSANLTTPDIKWSGIRPSDLGISL